MAHRAGLNGFAAPTRPEDFLDWALIVERLAAQAPLWPPWSTAAYHGMTWGWLTGELLRRVSGLMPREYIEQRIAGPTVNPPPDATAANRPDWRAAQIPAVNVHASADGLARLYAALAHDGGLDGTPILSPAGIAAMVRPRGRAHDEMLGERQWAAGVALNRGGLYGPHQDAFGHSGWGGSFGFADPTTARGVAYVVNRMGSALNGDPRARTLAQLAVAC